MVARLHALKHNVEREWEENDSGFLKDNAVISFTVFGGNIFAG